MTIALYPGGFKPPTKGHYSVVDNLLRGKARGMVYTQQNYKEVGPQILSTKGDKVEKVDKVVVLIGTKDRDGLGQELSEYIWNIYKNYIPGDVEVVITSKPPPVAVRDYVRDNPDNNYYVVTGVRNQDSIDSDMGKLNPVKNMDNVKGLGLSAEDELEGVSGSKLRAAAKKGDVEGTKSYLPSQLSQSEVEDIVSKIKDSIVAEEMGNQINELFDSWFNEEKVEEGSSGTPTAFNSIMKSSDRAKLVTLFNRIKNQIGTDGINIRFNQDHIRIDLKKGLSESSNSSNFNFTPYIGSIMEYMLDKGMNITPIPEVKLVRDIENASDVFGRTAHYSPVNNEITLYIEGRHPKDVLRSFTHEMIHHIQNLEGRLHGISTTNTNEDDNLLELEKEAYLEGNITFRNWEDGIKNPKQEVNEDSSYDDYEWLADELAEKYVTKFREDFEDFGITESFYEEYVDKKFIDFNLEVHLEFTDSVKDLEGDAYAVTDFQEKDIDYKDDDVIEIYIKVNPKLERPYELMQETMLQFLVHEMEHLLHGEGRNAIGDEYIREDNKIRSLINMGAMPAYTYRLLPREVAAALREFMAKAKSSGRELKDVINSELEREGYNKEEKEAILKAYRKRIKDKNFKVTLQEQEQDKVTFYLDMDGVLADFERRFEDLTGMHPDQYKKEYGKNAFWDVIDEDYKVRFWVGIPLMNGVGSLMDVVRNYDYQVLTAPSVKSQSKIGKHKWLDKHKGELFGGTKPKVKFKKSGQKHTIKTPLTKNDILIDDREENVDPWNAAGGTGILYKNINQVLKDIKKLGL